MFSPGDEPVPRYRLERLLGRGGFGEVWRALGPGQTPVAMKFISLAADKSYYELRAVWQIKEIRHPHLLPIHAFWALDEHNEPLDEESVQLLDTQAQRGWASGDRHALRAATLVIAMTLADTNLMQLLAQSPANGQRGIPADELLGYTEDAARGIDFLNATMHDFGNGPVAIQHCDIKPENIVLVGGSAMLCDFGLARVLEEGRATSAIAGTPAYMAPECISKSGPSRTTDQYALAITYYNLRTGRLPFTHTSFVDILNAHLRGELNFLSCSDAEREVLDKATSRDPEQRYGTALEMVRQLRTAVERCSKTVGRQPDSLPLTQVWPSNRQNHAKSENAAGPVISERISDATEGPADELVQWHFDRDMRIALIGALAIARETNWPTVTTVHLVLGLTYLSDGILSRSMSRSGVEPRAARHSLRSAIRQKEATEKAELSGFSNNVQCILEQAQQQAKMDGAVEVGERHVLTALSRLPDTGASYVLEFLNLSLAEVLARTNDNAEEALRPAGTTSPVRTSVLSNDVFAESGDVVLSRFDERGQSALKAACRRADTSGHDEVAPDDLVIGLLLVEDGDLAQRLQAAQVSVDDLSNTLQRSPYAPTGSPDVTPELHRDFLSRDLRQILHNAWCEAAQRGRQLVSDRDLLRALLGHDNQLSRQLRNRGIVLDDLSD